jgi:CRISPR-associated protein Cas6
MSVAVQRAAVVDLVFSLAGESLPRDHAQPLAAALLRRLPWLADAPDAGVHRINVVAGVGQQALLSNRARLAIRVGRERVPEVAALAGSVLDVGGCAVRLGEAVQRELLAHGTLYAQVVTNANADELQFIQSVERELDALGVRGRAICGRRRVLRDETGTERVGYSLLVDRLSADDSLRVQQHGLGTHRHLGCGVFVPHRSAAAVAA